MDATADDWYFGDDDGDDNPSGFSSFQNKISDWGNRMQERARENSDNRDDGLKGFARLAEEGAANKGSAAGKKGAGNNKYASAVDNAKDAETKDGFANNVSGKKLEDIAANKIPGGKLMLNQAKKFGPLGSILIVVITIISIFAGSQTFAPFGFVANGLDQFNNLRTAMNRRTTYFTRFSMDSTRNVKATRATIFGKEKFKISDNLSNKLKKNNVYYVDNKDVRFLIYEDDNTGKKYAIAASDEDVAKLPSSYEIEVDGKKMNFDFDERVKIDSAFETSSEFTKDFDKSTRTLKGHIAGWFDDLSEKVHGWLHNSRNRFKDAPDDADDEDIKTRAHAEGMDDDLNGDDGSTTSYHDEEVVINEETGETEIQRVPDGHSGGQEITKESAIVDSEANVKAKVSDNIKAKVDAIAGGVATATNVGCTVMKVFSAISAIIAAMHIANVINYVTGFLEAINKTQIGDGGKNELAYYMNSLSQRANTKDIKGEVVRENTNSLESPAWNQFFSSGSLVVQASDPLAEKYNTELVAQQSFANIGALSEGGSVMGDVLAAIAAAGTSVAFYRSCLYTEMGVQAATAVVDVVLAFFTGGIGNLIKQILGEVVETFIVNAIVAGVMAVFMSVVIPFVARLLMTDLISNMAGEDAAYAINSGFNIYAGKEMQISSGLPSDKEHLMAHWREQQDVIAEEGAYERSQRSPFDPTSKYTFIGSIVNSLMPVANTMSSPLTTISKTVNTVGTALTSLRPTAKAEGEAKFETSLRYDCPNLSQINAVGDAFCNPYFVTDFSTMGADPSHVMENVMTEDDKNGRNGNFKWENVDDAEHNGNPDINGNSELGKWVISCSTRQSQFGVIDSNVADGIARLVNSGNEFLDEAVNTGIGLLPVVGDIDQIRQDVMQAANFGWLTGEQCMDESSKYYSRYSEDQRMMESAGIIKQSSVAKFLDEYYKENPIDNSYEGMIARYSGLTKEQVVAAFDVAEYYEWLAQYDPETYGPMEFKQKPDGSWQYESNEIVASAEQAVVGNYIIFDDLRTKTKIA